VRAMGGESEAAWRAVLDDLVARGPRTPAFLITDGAAGLEKALVALWPAVPAQRCTVHKARNIAERLPKALRAPVRRALRQAWELDDAAKAERPLRNLARTLEPRAPGAAASILEELDEILTVVRLGLPRELRRSLACTNIVENVLGSVRRVSRDVKRWRDASMALRWTAAAMLEAAKGSRRPKAKRHLPALRAALIAHREGHDQGADCAAAARRITSHPAAPPAMLNIGRDIPDFGPGQNAARWAQAYKPHQLATRTWQCRSDRA